MSENYFMGLDGFVWFTGVVEDRNDPDKLGRVRVRCLGFHTENLNDIPTNKLPWAHVMLPVTSPAMQGLGHSPSFLVGNLRLGQSLSFTQTVFITLGLGTVYFSNSYTSSSFSLSLFNLDITFRASTNFKSS